MIEALQIRSPLAGAFFDGRGADLDNLIIFHLELQAAARFATKTDGMFDFFRHPYTSSVYGLKIFYFYNYWDDKFYEGIVGLSQLI
jgi:hypothetical protein